MDDFAAKMRWKARRDLRRAAILLAVTGAAVVASAFVSSMFVLGALVGGGLTLNYAIKGYSGFYALKNYGGMLDNARSVAERFEAIEDNAADGADES